DTEDVTFDNGDVLLVRDTVKTANVHAAVYKQQLTVQTQAVGPVNVSRGYNSADVTVRGARLHVVNTHLEAYDASVRLAQANEAAVAPLASQRPTILIGDLTTGPSLPMSRARPPYEAIAAAGFVPRRTKTFQCCLDELTDDPARHWDHIVDWIMSRGAGVAPVGSSVTGRETQKAGVTRPDHAAAIGGLRELPACAAP